MANGKQSLRVKASYGLIAVTIVTVAALTAIEKVPTGTEKAIAVKTAKVTIENYETLLTFDATLGFEGQYPAVTQTQGIVEAIYVAPGDTVLKGQALYKIDTTYQQAALQKAYEQRAKASLSDAQEAMVINEIAKRESSALETEIESLIWQMEGATARATKDGRVIDVMAVQGGYLGAAGVGAVLSGADEEITILALQRDAVRIQKGMKARIYADGKLVGMGEVKTVGALYQDMTTGKSQAKITVAPDKALNLPMGYKLKTEIILEAQNDALVVAADALDPNDTLWQVYEGRAFPLEGTVVRANESMAMLKDVDEGTQVVFMPDDNLTAGQRVKEIKP